MNRIMNLPEPLLPGIPSAPKGKRFITAAEIDYQRRKRQLAHRLPALKPEDLIGTLEQPFYQTLLRDLMASGNAKVADEINNLLRKEERDRKSNQVKTRMLPDKLIDQPEVLQRIADTLKLEQTLLHEGKKESAMLICKHLADSFLLQDHSVWLARHFYLAVLSRCRKICPHSTERLQAEIHCLLAYIARENNENLESALAVAIDHLAVCRTLSRDQNWQFKPNTILVKLKRPIAFYGITSDDVYEVVDACTMSIYMIASLLEHELLISLANQIMHSPHHKAPTDDDLKNAHEFADLALQLALEVRQPVALSSALTRFGIVLRHVGAYEDAMKYFQQLQQHANLIGDTATEAIAFHNMGLCYIGMLNSVDALECFAKQKELATLIAIKELEGNSMHEIGHLLLQEGHLWEAEECYLVAFESFYYAQQARNSLKDSMKTTDHEHDHASHHETVNRTEIAWAMSGVAAGQKQWSRLAGLCRSEQSKDLRSVLQFKCGRKPLSVVGRPDYTVQDISEIDKPWESNNVKYIASTDITEEFAPSETSWEQGFMFAGEKQSFEKGGSKKVGFDENVLESLFPQEDMEVTLKELKDMADKDEKEKAAASLADNVEQEKATASLADNDEQGETAASLADNDEQGETAESLADNDEQGETAASLADNDEQGNTAASLADNDEQGKAAPSLADKDEQGNTAASLAGNDEQGKVAPSLADNDEQGKAAPSLADRDEQRRASKVSNALEKDKPTKPTSRGSVMSASALDKRATLVDTQDTAAPADDEKTN